MEFKTFDKSSSKVLPYLTGRFSKNKIALPIQNISQINASTITFRIVSKKDIQRPSFIVVIMRLFRVELLNLTLFPLFISTLIHYSSINSENLLYVVLVFLSVFGLHCAVFLLNDFYDHIKGGDRVTATSGTQVIQNGWMSAYQVKRIAYTCLLFSVICGVPLVLQNSMETLILGLMAICSVVGFSLFGKGFKYLGVGEFFIFLFLGPLLTASIPICLGLPVDQPTLYLGCVYGWMAVFYQQAQNLCHIMPDSFLNVGTFVSRIGFDRSKWLLRIHFFLILVFVSMLFFYWAPFELALLGVVLLAIVSYRVFKNLKSMDSPLSSSLIKLPKSILVQHTFTSLFLSAVLLVTHRFL